MERHVDKPALIGDDLGVGEPGDDFAARFAAEGLEAIADYLGKWAAFRALAGDDD